MEITKDSIFRVCGSLIFSSITDQPLIIIESKKRRCGSVSLINVNNFNSTVLLLPHCNTRVCGSKVYSYCTTFVLCRNDLSRK